MGVIPFEFRHDLWHLKTRVMGLSCGVVYVILRLDPCLCVCVCHTPVLYQNG